MLKNVIWSGCLPLKMLDVRIAKRQQWSVVYYGFLLQSGLLSFVLIAKDNNIDLPKAVLKFSSIAICIVVIVVLSIFQRNMKDYRRLIKKLENDGFAERFNKLVEPFYDKRKNYLEFLYGSEFLILMILSSVFIMSLIIWFIAKAKV